MISMPKVQYDVIQMKGGLDQVTPPLALPAGVAKESLNFECSVTGGYSRIVGYERFDGRSSPSNATYTAVFIDSFVNIPTIGTTLTGQTSLATGTVIAVGANYVIVTQKAGAYIFSELVFVGLTQIGLTVPQVEPITPQNNAIYLAQAAEVYRALIAPIPGSGPAIGGFMYNDIVYALRANALGTAVDMYKSSAAGWVQVPFFFEVGFTAGTSAVVEGATLAQGGATAVVMRVMLESGAWSGTAAGRLIITTIVGGPFAAGAATSGASTLTLSAAETAITMAVGGKLQFVEGNFYGSAATNRVYAADGINRCFEFDGVTVAPISTGVAIDTPKHIAIHKGYLFVSQGASVMRSAPGLPYDWTALSGAGEIGVGQDVTGMLELPGAQTTATLMVTSRSNTYMLYGTSSSDFNFVTFNTGAGANSYTQQNMSQSYMLDDRGVVSLQASLNFGNFDQSTLTANINPYMAVKRSKASYATLDRRKSQYRIFFNDGDGLYITVVNQQLMGCMPIHYPDIVYMCWEDKYSTGEEASFFCSTNGFVYQMDKGTSFDGQPIDAYITLNYASQRSARVNKRYRKTALEVTGSGYSQIYFKYTLGYQSPQISQPNTAGYESNTSLAQWDAFTWDAFTWDGRTVTPTECEMAGTAENVALTFASSTNYTQSFTINSAIVHYTPRRGLR